MMRMAGPHDADIFADRAISPNPIRIKNGMAVGIGTKRHQTFWIMLAVAFKLGACIVQNMARAQFWIKTHGQRLNQSQIGAAKAIHCSLFPEIL